MYFADPASQISRKTRPTTRPQHTNPSFKGSVSTKVKSTPAAVHGVVRVNEGSKITLLCSITVSLGSTCDVKWYHKNKWLVMSSGYKTVPRMRSTYLVSINGKLEENSLDMFQSSFSGKGNKRNSSLILNQGQSFASFFFLYIYIFIFFTSNLTVDEGRSLAFVLAAMIKYTLVFEIQCVT